jgi:hypothetical protein
MLQPRILVTGATGKTGRVVVAELLQAGYRVGAPTTDVLEATGRPAEDFETIARRYPALPRNRLTLGNRMREFAEFLIAPLRPGPNLDRYDRELRRPFPSAPQFATESGAWRSEHIESPMRPTRIAELREMFA